MNIKNALSALMGRHSTIDAERADDLLERLTKETSTLKAATLEMQRLIPLLHSYQGFLRLNNDERRLAVFIRDNYQDEIKRGKHDGMSACEVAMLYMSQERSFVTGRMATPPAIG